MEALRRDDILYPELSYKLIGILFDVFNTLGYGYREKYYQRAIAESLTQNGVLFKQEFALPIHFKGKNIGVGRADFLIEDKIILEVKRGDRISRSDIEQTHTYLKAGELKLGILARFSSKQLMYKRIVNADSYIRKNS